MTNATLHTKYRPQTLDEIVGHETIVSSLRRVLQKGSCRCFIFVGPSGTGKTTLARLIAKELGAVDANVIEVDGATHTGVDSMREVTQNMGFAGLGKSSTKVYIIDECHMLTGAAWNSSLKAIEEPPPHVAWCLCTTVAGKIPTTIVNRSTCYTLKPIESDLIYKLLRRVRKSEQMETADEVLDLLAKKCEGSPRRALTWLAQVGDTRSRKEAARLIETSVENGDVIELCRALVQGTTWPRALEIIKRIENPNPEAIRIVVRAYFSKVLFNATTEDRAGRLLAVLEAFGDPYPPGADLGHVLTSLGGILL